MFVPTNEPLFILYAHSKMLIKINIVAIIIECVITTIQTGSGEVHIRQIKQLVVLGGMGEL